MNIFNISSANFLFAGILGLCSSATTPDNCDKFRTGKYLIRGKINEEWITTSIVRNDSVQIETNSATGEHSKLSIRWTSPCTYELRLIESTAKFSESVQQMRKKHVLTATILSFTDKYYVFEAKSNVFSMVMRDTLWIEE
jgi:hypothetical protein